MFETMILQIITEIITIFISIPFGLVTLTFGAIVYVPTGIKIGKYSIFYGLFVLTLNAYLI